MTVLAAIDFSEPSANALRFAAREARLRDLPLAVAHCVDTSPSGFGALRVFDVEQSAPERLRKAAREKLEDFVDAQLPAADCPDEINWYVEFGAPADGIGELARRLSVELIVQGTAGRGRFGSALLGSTAEEVIRSTTYPVLTVPADADLSPPERILVPVDFSEFSRRALSLANEWKDRLGATLVVHHEGVLPSSELGRPDLGPSEEVLDSFRENLSSRFDEWCTDAGLDDTSCDKILNVHSYRTRKPAAAIAEVARSNDIDLVVMGTHGRRGFRRFLIGSTTFKVLHDLPAPLLTVGMTD